MSSTKTYILAGSGSAIAKASADMLQAQGHKVIQISRSIPENDLQFQVEKYEMGNFPKIEEKVNGLVYFPGTINLKSFGQLTMQDFQQDFSIHVLGAIAFVKSYINMVEKDGKSSIVFISSVAGSVGMPFHSSVSVSKAALEGLTKSLAAEFAPSVRVNAIAPSLVNTPLGERFVNTPEKLSAIEKRNPMRKVGDPADIANMINFLLSEQSSWITGQVLGVDGGMNNIKL
ncbi:MAG: SDR family oxidoreductase [Chitinophagia bacterium]|nr:SDR family oxidoreductase [Chitinophagia bacterium]